MRERSKEVELGRGGGSGRRRQEEGGRRRRRRHQEEVKQEKWGRKKEEGGGGKGGVPELVTRVKGLRRSRWEWDETLPGEPRSKVIHEGGVKGHAQIMKVFERLRASAFVISSALYLFIYQSIRLSVYMSMYKYVILSFFLSICLSTNTSFCLYVCLYVYLQIHHSVYMSVYKYIILSVCLSIYLYPQTWPRKIYLQNILCMHVAEIAHGCRAQNRKKKREREKKVEQINKNLKRIQTHLHIRKNARIIYPGKEILTRREITQ